SAVVVYDEERDAHVAGRVVRRAWNQGDRLSGLSPQRLERSRLGRASLRTAPRGAATCRQRSKREDGEQSAHMDTLKARAVVHAVLRQGGRQQRQQSCRDENREDREIGQASFGHLVTPFRRA